MPRRPSETQRAPRACAADSDADEEAESESPSVRSSPARPSSGALLPKPAVLAPPPEAPRNDGLWAIKTAPPHVTLAPAATAEGAPPPTRRKLGFSTDAQGATVAATAPGDTLQLRPARGAVAPPGRLAQLTSWTLAARVGGERSSATRAPVVPPLSPTSASGTSADQSLRRSLEHHAAPKSVGQHAPRAALAAPKFGVTSGPLPRVSLGGAAGWKLLNGSVASPRQQSSTVTTRLQRRAERVQLRLTQDDLRDLTHFHRSASVVFLDVPDFDKMVSLNASVVMVWLNNVFGLLDGVVARHDVHKVRGWVVQQPRNGPRAEHAHVGGAI